MRKIKKKHADGDGSLVSTCFGNSRRLKACFPYPVTYDRESTGRRIRSCRGRQGRYSFEQCIGVVVVFIVFVVVNDMFATSNLYGCMRMFITVMDRQASATAWAY
ncbi:MAG: hypothetical protein K2L45_11625 [Muribaculaceae bacterium]|nr:hypothetical protein [Muribaculaceae bacterium]MDE6480904.1 hypothetical protein [Muribaculaceae bacterium]